MTEKQNNDRREKFVIPLERYDHAVVDCCGTCELATWVHRAKYRFCTHWHTRLVYPERERLTRQRCWAHVFSNQTNATELRAALLIEGAPLIDQSRDRPQIICDVPLADSRPQPQPKGLYDPTRKIPRLTDQEIQARLKEREQEAMWRILQAWDGT